MNTYDLTPLFRHSIGFDHLEDIFDSMVRLNSYSENYPPYNIKSNGKNQYSIELAVAGFDEKDLSIDLDNGQLTVVGNKENTNGNFMHQGIATRSFKRTFQLAEYVEVIGAGLINGLLTIALEKKLPEELRPKKIEISTGSNLKKFTDKISKVIEGEKA
ncbi:MAG: Small heat shock protein IbpA [Alphaproteobacteria bacterium MarineAlpha9_Bin1]|nr:MAG: Small heat shock protein IbpA [Alphaproteobacteria bacterium MarineAlpha9_Bin1]